MRSPIDLRNDAMDCLRVAEQAKARGRKTLFLLMAQAWTRLAEQAEHIGALPEDAAAQPAGVTSPTSH